MTGRYLYSQCSKTLPNLNPTLNIFFCKEIFFKKKRKVPLDTPAVYKAQTYFENGLPLYSNLIAQDNVGLVQASHSPTLSFG